MFQTFAGSLSNVCLLYWQSGTLNWSGLVSGSSSHCCMLMHVESRLVPLKCEDEWLVMHELKRQRRGVIL